MEQSSPNELLEKKHLLAFGDGCVALTEHCSCAEPRGLVLFLHGRFGYGEMWSHLARDLSRHFRCLVVDMPGFGRSYVLGDRPPSLARESEIAVELIKRFGSGPAVIIGHDIGGSIGQICAVNHPGHLHGLVLINSPCVSLQLGMSLRFEGALIRWTLRRLLHDAKNLRGLPRREISDLWTWASERGSRLQALYAIGKSWPGERERKLWKEAIGKLELPVLLLWGAKDRLNPPRIASELMQRLPDAHLHQHDGCGHWPCLEDPEWVVQRVREYLFRLLYQGRLRYRTRHHGTKTGNHSKTVASRARSTPGQTPQRRRGGGQAA